MSLLQNETEPVEGVMQDFLRKVQNRLKIEVCTERSNDSLCKKKVIRAFKIKKLVVKKRTLYKNM